MNIRLKFLLVFLLLSISKNLGAQTQSRVGILPSINYNHKINKDWDVNFKYESRHFIYENNALEDGEFQYSYALSDFAVLAGRKTGFDSKFVLGILTRVEPGAMSYRTIQQFIFQTKINTFRVAHRIVSDQTFSSQELPEFRLRYRLSAEIPLSGQKVDFNEFYFKFNTEALNSIQDNIYDLEFRVVPNIGYVINEQHKIELGLDNRFNSFINNKTRFTTWITINWYL